MTRPYKYRVWNGREMVSPDYIDRQGYAHWKEDSIQCQSQKIVQFTGVQDKNHIEVYAEDILSDGEHAYRVYSMYGGFAIKAPHWSKDMSDMGVGDDLIMMPLSDAQTAAYINTGCTIIGNIYANPELLKP